MNNKAVIHKDKDSIKCHTEHGSESKSNVNGHYVDPLEGQLEFSFMEDKTREGPDA